MMDGAWEWGLILACLGVISGLVGGMVGIGGGVITVPSFLMIFRAQGYPQDQIMHMAIATSLGAMIFNTFSASWAYHKRGAILWSILRQMAVGILAGSILGVALALFLSKVILEIFFGIFILVLSLRFMRARAECREKAKAIPKKHLPLWGGILGLFANLLGVGGGTLMVPLLKHFGVPDKRAYGTSSAASCFVATLGTVSYLILGWTRISEDYIDLPCFLIVGVFSFFAAPLGTKLTYYLPQQRVKQCFGVLLFVTGVSLILKGV